MEKPKKQTLIVEKNSLQLDQWSSCCMVPVLDALAIHHLSPLGKRKIVVKNRKKFAIIEKKRKILVF